MITLDIQHVCSDVANKLADIPSVISTCLKQSNWIPDFNSPSWNPVTLAYGYPGLICFFSEINHFFPDQKWEDLSHYCVESLVSDVKTFGVANDSLFSGYAGVCFALDLASKEGQLYPGLRMQLHKHLLEKIQINYIKPLKELLKASLPVHPRLYDPVSGISGILAYLLNHADEKETRACILEILNILVGLTESIEVKKAVVPGWFIDFKDIVPIPKEMSHSLGACNTGLAHGVSSCLAILAKATLQGVSVPGQEEAMRRIVTWLQSHRQNIGNFKDVWPSYIYFKDHVEVVTQSSYRDGWCYGAPGIVFSLFLAGCALKDSRLYDYAVDAMKSVCQRYETQNTLTCPSLCHGLSGLLAMVHQMYLATKDEIFLNTSTRISGDILKKYNNELPFGFTTDFSSKDRELFIDNQGFMDGVVGIVLSLLFQLSDRPRPWLPIFLLG